MIVPQAVNRMGAGARGFAGALAAAIVLSALPAAAGEDAREDAREDAASRAVVITPWTPPADSVAAAVPSRLESLRPRAPIRLGEDDAAERAAARARAERLAASAPVIPLPSPDPGEAVFSLPLGPGGEVVPAENLEQLRGDAQTRAQINRDRLERIRELMKISRWDEAIRLCRMVLAEDPGNGRARALLSQAFQRRRLGTQADIRSDYEEAAGDIFNEYMHDARPRVPARGELRPDLFADVMKLYPRNVEADATADAILRQRIPVLNYTNTDLSFILSTLYEVADVNLVYNEADVSGKPQTVRVRNVTLKDLLDIICPPAGLGYAVRNGMVIIHSASDANAAKAYMDQLIVDLKYPPTRSGGGGGAASSAGGGGSSRGSGGGAGASSAAGGAAGEAGEYDVVQLMTWIAENLPGWTEESKWRFDDKFNRMLVIAPAPVLAEVERLIRTIDMPPVQVVISTHFVSINEQTMRGFGLDFGVDPHPFEVPEYIRDPRYQGTGGDDEDEDGDYDDWIQVPSNHMGIINGSASLGVAGPDISMGLQTVIGRRRLSVIMNIINNDSNSTVVNSPRTIALNNQTTTINLTEQFRYASDWEVATTSGVSSQYTSSQSNAIMPSEWDEEELGAKLTVTPSVGRDMRTIVLRVVPEITSLDRKESYPIMLDSASSSGTSSGVNTSVHTVEQPIFSTNTLDAQAVIEDGYTLVVGGQFRDDFTTTEKRVPGLHRLPLLGRLFKSENKTASRRCLLIFVTAKILTPRNAYYTDSEYENRRHEAQVELLRPRSRSGGPGAGGIDGLVGRTPPSWSGRRPPRWLPE